MEGTQTQSSLNREPAERSIHQKRTILLDTQGTCFLCCKDYSSGGGDASAGVNRSTGVGERMTEVCLRNVCRHMKISMNTHLIRCLKHEVLQLGEEEELPLIHQNGDFSVKMCESCSALTQNISALAGQMEMMKIIMNHQLKEFQQVLMDSEQESESDGETPWAKLMVKLADWNNPAEWDLIAHLRLLAKNKLEETRKPLPRVSLSRLEMSNDERPNSLPNLDSIKTSPIIDDVSDSDSEVEFENEIDVTHGPGSSVLNIPSPTQSVISIASSSGNEEQAVGIPQHLQVERIENPIRPVETPKIKDRKRKDKLNNKRWQRKRQRRNSNNQKWTKKKDRPWICNISEGGCGKRYVHEIAFRKHKINHCPNRQKGTCGNGSSNDLFWKCNREYDGKGCSRVFSTLAGLRRHRTRACSKKRSGNVSNFQP